MRTKHRTAETSDARTTILAEHYRVYLPERRGHGRTTCPGPLTFEIMAAGTIAFLEALNLAGSSLVGWSDAPRSVCSLRGGDPT